MVSRATWFSLLTRLNLPKHRYVTISLWPPWPRWTPLPAALPERLAGHEERGPHLKVKAKKAKAIKAEKAKAKKEALKATSTVRPNSLRRLHH